MHRTIGIIGGLSPESTVAYYERITRNYTRQYGNYGYPEILIYSVSLQTYLDWQDDDRWDLVAEGLCQAAQSLEAAGADFIIIATNTMHLLFDQVSRSVRVPMISIIDAVADAIEKQGLTRVGLLGTRFTMSRSFYREALEPRGINVIVPDTNDKAFIDKVIYTELTAGILRKESRGGYLEVIGRLRERGAQGVILGCTEIPLLVKQEDVDIPLIDTMAIHADAALRFAMKGS
jgi:aspartate racemase